MMKKDFYLKPSVEVVKLMDELCAPTVASGDAEGGGDGSKDGDHLAPKRKSFVEDGDFSVNSLFGTEAADADASSWE